VSAWLSALLDPISLDEFVSGYWLKRPLIARGTTDRFAPLLSWADFNRILEHHWRETARFRLAMKGRDLDPAAYADLEGSTPRIRARDLTDHLRRGATLAFAGIDELHQPLTTLARSFEAFFRASTNINVYAGWGREHGLDLHRDDQEIFVLQVDGRKRWLLYGFALDGIDARMLASSGEPPAGAMLDEVLTAGGWIYIPRGCYHLAVPMNEPTLHLTISVKNPRELDLLQWLVERLRARGIADRDVPCLADEAERIRFSDAMRSMLLDDLDEDLVRQYLDETGSNLKPRASLGLPWSATASRLPPGRDFQICLAAHPLTIVNGLPDGSSIEVQCRGREYRFPHAMRWVLDPLRDGTPLAMAQLIGSLSNRLDEDSIRLLVAMLVAHDLVSVSA
jgi:ribosomal protein L16 Arg81 hydroxylase